MKLTVEKFEKKEDGTAVIEFDYDDEFLQLVKEHLGKEEPTEDEINGFIFRLVEARQDALREEQSE